MNTFRFIVSIFVCLSSILPAIAQLGYSSGSYGQLRQNSDYLNIPQPHEIYVNEILNYHRHHIPVPTRQKAAVSLAYLKPTFDAQGKNWLQVGIATQQFEDNASAPAANITLVIDRSGSMQGDRIQNAKAAAVALVEMLRPKDRVAVVAFDDQIEVTWPSSLVNDQKGAIIAAIRTLDARGSTDLDGGMVEGYNQTIRHYSPEVPSKIIMLTDAIANTGNTDPMVMAQKSKFYDERYHVEMAMVGIGVDFNQKHSRMLTGSQGASLHFLHDGQDIQKVFVEEFQTLIAPIGKNPVLTVQIPMGVHVEGIPGYPFTQEGNQINLPLERINAGLTEVILIEVSGKSGDKTPMADATLTYSAYGTDKAMVVKGEEGSTAKEVLRNLSILRMAISYRNMAADFHQNRFQKGQQALQQTLAEIRLQFPPKADSAVDNLYDLLEKYDQSLGKYIASLSPVKN